MTDNNHPITPPPELIQHWLGNYFGCIVNGELSPSENFLATQAARWGADMELEACIKYFFEYDSSWGENSELITGLRTARRPKPKSLAEEALEELQSMEGAMYSADLGCDFTATRRALKRLQELEGQGDG